MPIVVLAVAGAGLLLAPWALRPLGRRLPPAHWSRCAGLFLAVGAVAVLLAAAVLASPAVLRAAGLPDVAQACRRLLGRLVPAWQVLGWPVAALSTASVTMGARAWWRVRGVYRSMRVEPWLGRHQDYDGFDLVVLPTVAPLALSVAGPHGQILISEGLVASLGPDYLEAVLAHEAAHLRYGHSATWRWRPLSTAPSGCAHWCAGPLPCCVWPLSAGPTRRPPEPLAEDAWPFGAPYCR